MKISEITSIDVCNYLRISEINTDTEKEIEMYLEIAKNYIENYTGISRNGKDESLDSFSDFVIVVLMLCQDMYDNRTLYVDKQSINKTVQTILNMHTRNLI